MSKKSFLINIIIFSYLVINQSALAPDIFSTREIKADSVDDLILEGISFINEEGLPFRARAGSGKQIYEIAYTLTNPLARVHWLRKPTSVIYFCRELQAYFKGSLKVDNGLSSASSFWKKLADENGEICSNYGYYIFHQQENGVTQYEWVIQNLIKNKDSRRAFININQLIHKNPDNKDFPCTIGLLFFIVDNFLCCSVSSRSTDVITGLPYDMGFFALVTELIYKDLKERRPELFVGLKLGFVRMKTSFSQIYDKTANIARNLSNMQATSKAQSSCLSSTMPEIENAKEFLDDIYNQTINSNVMKWIDAHANQQY